MTVKFVVTLAAAVTVGALAVLTSAQAQQSMSVLGGTSSATNCADQAAIATRGGNASSRGIDTCDDAIRHLALAQGELAATYVNRGVLHLTLGNYAAAIADDDAALRIQGDLADAFVNRGAALHAEKRFADAVGDFDRAIALTPRHAEQVYYNRGLAREDLGDLKGAYLDYLKASQLDPSWNLPKTELARFTVARAAQG
jgi:tetratricopeptide (TPR) repeat protein